MFVRLCVYATPQPYCFAGISVCLCVHVCVCVHGCVCACVYMDACVPEPMRVSRPCVRVPVHDVRVSVNSLSVIRASDAQTAVGTPSKGGPKNERDGGRAGDRRVDREKGREEMRRSGGNPGREERAVGDTKQMNEIPRRGQRDEMELKGERREEGRGRETRT